MGATTDAVEMALRNNLLIKTYGKGEGGVMQTKLLELHSVCGGHEADLLN
jgi:hypothetical protein